MATYNQLTAFAKGEAVTFTATAQTPPIAITGWTIAFYLKRSLADPTLLLTVPAVITDAVNGIYTVSLTDAQTSLLTAGIYQFDIWRIDAGSETRLAYGPLTILPDTKYGL